MKCPAYLVYDHCHKACIKICENSTSLSVCKDYPTEGCFCPNGQVVFNDSCVGEEVCTQCISEDGTHHQVTVYFACCLHKWLWSVLLQVNLSSKPNYFSLRTVYLLALLIIIRQLIIISPISFPSVKLAGMDIKLTAGTVHIQKHICMEGGLQGREEEWHKPASSKMNSSFSRFFPIMTVKWLVQNTCLSCIVLFL